MGMALVSTQKALSLVQEQVAGHRGILEALRPTAFPNIQKSSRQTDSRQSGHRRVRLGLASTIFHLLFSCLSQETQEAGERDLFFILSLIRKLQERKLQGVNGRGGEVLGSEETDRGNRKRVGSDWCSLGACMSVYLTVSVYSAVFSLLSLSLSLWCSCQSTDCRSVSASAAPHTLSLRPECSKADNELLTVAWANT